MKKVIIYLILAFVLIQFIGIDKTVPMMEGHLDFIEIEEPSKAVSVLIKTTCYDCHSYETKYPWYSNLAPISWILSNHVKEGREYLNFSTWGNYTKEVKKDLLYKSYKQIGARQMPLANYLLLHNEAKIENDQLESFYHWFKTKSENIKL